MCEFISGLPIFFHWSAFLFLCQYHTILMNITLRYSLKSGRLIPPVPFFFLKIALANWGLLCFHMNCESFWSSSVKNAIVYWCYFKLTAQNSDSLGMVLSSICCLLLYAFFKKTFSTPSISLMGIYSSVYLCFSHSLRNHVRFVQDLSVTVLAFMEICVYGTPPSFIPPSCDYLISHHHLLWVTNTDLVRCFIHES